MDNRPHALCLKYLKALDKGVEHLDGLRSELASLTPEGRAGWIHGLEAEGAVAYVREQLSVHPEHNHLPEGLSNGLELKYRKVQAKSAYLLEEFGRLTEALQAQGIPCIALKGIYLSQALYRDVTHRTFSDIDILFRQRDIGGVFEVVQKLGYRLPPSKFRYWHERCYYNVPVVHEGPVRFTLDVHWHMTYTYRYRVDMDGVWERSVPWKGETVRALCPEDLVLHLALHAVSSYCILLWSRWRDFALTLETFPVNMGVLAKRAQEWQASAALYAALKKAAQNHASESLNLMLDQIEVPSYRMAALNRWVIGNGSDSHAGEEEKRYASRGRRELYNILMVDRISTALWSEVRRVYDWIRYGVEPKDEAKRWRKSWRKNRDSEIV